MRQRGGCGSRQAEGTSLEERAASVCADSGRLAKAVSLMMLLVFRSYFSPPSPNVERWIPGWLAGPAAASSGSSSASWSPSSGSASGSGLGRCT